MDGFFRFASAVRQASLLLLCVLCAACSRGPDATAPGAVDPPAATTPPGNDAPLRFLGLTAEPARETPAVAFDAALVPDGTVLAGMSTPEGFEILRPSYVFQWRAGRDSAWKDEPVDAGSYATPPDRLTLQPGQPGVLLFPIDLREFPQAMAGKGELRVCLRQEQLELCSRPVEATRLGEVYAPDGVQRP